LVALEHVPKELVQGLIVIEDHQFYQHFGVSWRGIFRAAWVNLTTGQLRQGGSTLTQQLVKNFYLTSERTFSRKFREMIMALLLEFHYEKADILEAYLNEVFLGQAKNRAVHGVGLASQFYFGVPAAELSVEQSALLIGLVKGASYYNPRRYPKRARARRDLVLDEMLGAQVITPDVHAAAVTRPLGVLDNPSYNTNYYPAYINLVKRQLRVDYKEVDLRSEGLRLFTSLDPTVQHAAEIALQNHLEVLEKRFPSTEGVQGAVVVASAQHGEVLALVGGKQLRYQGFNRALDARRQIGSLVKPALVLAAVESRDYHLASVVSDEPISITLEDGTLWTPTNYDNESHGDVTVLKALEMSYNQSMVRLGIDIGVQRVMSALNRLGLPETPSAVPSLLLGAIEASPFEMTAVYQTIANHGFSNPLKAIRAVLTATGEQLSRYDMSIDQSFDEADINQVQFALTHVMSHGTGRSFLNQLPDLRVAGKTGTSDGQRDAWFVGFNQDYVVAVWVGFDDNRPTPFTGSSAALPVWTDIMRRLNAKSFEILPAPELEFAWINPAEQAISAENCPDAIYVPIRKSSLPTDISRCAAAQQSPIKRVKEGIRGWLKKIF
jgi:penicillin-binding protein 1B